jgi:hypothetical protein
MDWNYWLGRKYDIQQQTANADTARAGGFVTQSNAAAGLDLVRAGLLPAQTKADINLSAAQAALAGANARNVDETTKFVGPLAKSSIGLNAAQAGNQAADTTLTQARVRGLGLLDRLQQLDPNFHLGALFGNQ